MKLRNKKTGEMGELHYYPDKDYHFAVEAKDPTQTRIYETLAKLIEDWEDYKPKEPLIKDEKIRKAVRAWAEASGTTSIVVFDCNNAPCMKIDEMEFAENGGRVSIAFKTSEKIDTSKAYTVTELCGEEQE